MNASIRKFVIVPSFCSLPGCRPAQFRISLLPHASKTLFVTGGRLTPTAAKDHASVRDNKSITTLEFDVVNGAASYCLNLKLDEEDAEIQQLKQSVAQLQALVSQLAHDRS